MARLVHITGEAEARSIKRSGIRLGRPRRVIYFMPLAAGHHLSYQWARELTRQGVRNHVAVHFQLPDEAIVWHGPYNAAHTRSPLRQAIATFLRVAEPLGYEFFVDERINRTAISAFKAIRRPLGWRYYPAAHGRKPCGCPACSLRGEYKSAARRSAWVRENEPRISEPEARRIISEQSSDDQICTALWAFSRKRRQDDPSFLFHLLDRDDEFVVYDALRAIGSFAHPQARRKLEHFLTSADPDLKELAEEKLKERGWWPLRPESVDQ